MLPHQKCAQTEEHVETLRTSHSKHPALVSEGCDLWLHNKHQLGHSPWTQNRGISVVTSESFEPNPAEIGCSRCRKLSCHLPSRAGRNTRGISQQKKGPWGFPSEAHLHIWICDYWLLLHMFPILIQKKNVLVSWTEFSYPVPARPRQSVLDLCGSRMKKQGWLQFRISRIQLFRIMLYHSESV